MSEPTPLERKLMAWVNNGVLAEGESQIAAEAAVELTLWREHADALARYAAHRTDCAITTANRGDPEWLKVKCTCGLAEALAERNRLEQMPVDRTWRPRVEDQT